MRAVSVPMSYRGGPLCGTPGTIQLDPDGQAPVLAAGRYAHAVDCPCGTQPLPGEQVTHRYEWRPEHTGPRPHRVKACCQPAGRGCPCYIPKASAP